MAGPEIAMATVQVRAFDGMGPWNRAVLGLGSGWLESGRSLPLTGTGSGGATTPAASAQARITRWTWGEWRPRGGQGLGTGGRAKAAAGRPHACPRACVPEGLEGHPGAGGDATAVTGGVTVRTHP